MKKRILIKIGGSIIVPLSGKIDVKFLKNFLRLILNLIKRGYKFIIVVGGGRTARLYQKTADQITKITYKNKDWIGIYATWLNAQLIRAIFKEKSYPLILDNPHKKIKKEFLKRPIIIAGGWKPGWSTDYDAVLLAERFKIKEIIDAGNIDHVYDKDLDIYTDAKPIEKLSWREYQKLISSYWIPGLPTPIDPVAAKKSKELKLKTFITKGTDLKNLKNLILNKKFQGTTIG